MKSRGVPPSTADYWYRKRAKTGTRRRPADRPDHYWYEDEWASWYQAHLRARTGSLTRVDHQGDPDDLVDATEAARVMGYANRHVVTANRRLGYFPEPDEYGRLPGAAPPAVEAVHSVGVRRHRPGQGGGGGRKPGASGVPAKPTGMRATSGWTASLAELRSDAQPSSAQLATEWNVSRRTAERISAWRGH